MINDFIIGHVKDIPNEKDIVKDRNGVHYICILTGLTDSVVIDAEGIIYLISNKLLDFADDSISEATKRELMKQVHDVGDRIGEIIRKEKTNAR